MEQSSKRIVVYHGYYGCETGCCGHYVVLNPIMDEEGKIDLPIEGEQEEFTFDHPWEKDADKLEWAKQWVKEAFGEEHIKDLDWDNCHIVED